MSPSIPFCFGIHQSLDAFVQRYSCCRDFLAGLGVQLPGGARAQTVTWAQACQQTQVDPVIALGDFAAAVHCPREADRGDWTEATLDELIRNIVDDHHSFVRCQLGRMDAMLMLLIHTAPRPSERLDRARASLTYLCQRWSGHMDMEEQEFFPACLRLDTSRDFVDREELDRLVASLHRTSHDHREIDLFAERLVQALELIEDTIDRDRMPVLSCLRKSLSQFVDDARVHSGKEDDILLPAVLFAHDIRRSDSESGRFSSL